MYANDLASNDGTLRIIAVGQGHGDPKSDAFIVTFGSYVLLLDGGLATNYSALQSLLDIRSDFLKEKRNLLTDTSVKLKITWIASHWHIDHTGIIGAIAMCPYIEISDAYFSALTNYVAHRPKHLDWINGDWSYRPQFHAVMQQYQSQCTFHEIRFGSSPADIVSFRAQGVGGNVAVFDIFPSVRDWGESLESIQAVATAKDEAGDMNNPLIPLAIINANSLWVKVSYKNTSVLFTGDTLKTSDREDDPMDLMIKAWKDEIGSVEVIHYPHHGLSRDEAAKNVAMFNSSYILFTGMNPTAPAALDALDPQYKRANIGRYVYSFEHDVIFSIDEGGTLTVDTHESALSAESALEKLR
jgi:glyoxylase-like metal-dependent hydrolase (beta-lactamase superfamily II)